MKTITISADQSLIDIALQHYGNAEAVSELLANNPSIRNDPRVLQSLGHEPDRFYLDAKLCPGDTLMIDGSSRLLRKNIVKRIEMEVTTWQEP